LRVPLEVVFWDGFGWRTVVLSFFIFSFLYFFFFFFLFFFVFFLGVRGGVRIVELNKIRHKQRQASQVQDWPQFFLVALQ
jgi:hypothetical protein